jgi:hypothetical protein
VPTSSACSSNWGSSKAPGRPDVCRDCQIAYDELSARGVVFNDPPTPQPYGIDTSFRDPSGNNVRLTQVLDFSIDRR